VRIPSLLVLACLTCACERFGGGIAGASWDSQRDRAEVENYQGYTSPRLSEVVVGNNCNGNSSDTFAGISQHFEDIFRTFSFHHEGIGSTPVEIPNTGAITSFAGGNFKIEKAGKLLVQEPLPAVFRRPMWLGCDTLSGVPVIMVINKSRASTGRRFVAIYTFDGTLLYRNVLVTWQVWDIKRNANTIEILGCSETRKISIKGN
jgi:hypothetical protein